MLREKAAAQQGEYEIVLLEELVAEDHLLRKIDRAVDFSFIHDLCKDLYCPDNGRPAIEPELLFRMLFIVWRSILNGLPNQSSEAVCFSR